MLTEIINIFTDGSCHTQHCAGAWVSIVFINDQKIILSGTELQTTHNRMELLAVINALEYIENKCTNPIITLVTDSQYVTGLQAREAKFITQNYTTKKGTTISNADLVKTLLKLVHNLQPTIIKIKAHQSKTDVVNYNIEADILSRNMVRQMVKNLPSLQKDIV